MACDLFFFLAMWFSRRTISSFFGMIPGYIKSDATHTQQVDSLEQEEHLIHLS